jgi:hypothetical protein
VPQDRAALPVEGGRQFLQLSVRLRVEVGLVPDAIATLAGLWSQWWVHFGPLLGRPKEPDDRRFSLTRALEVFPHDHISPTG